MADGRQNKPLLRTYATHEVFSKEKTVMRFGFVLGGVLFPTRKKDTAQHKPKTKKKVPSDCSSAR
jgi:hypothetical protein